MTSVLLVQCSTNWAIKPTGSWPYCEWIYFKLGKLMRMMYYSCNLQFLTSQTWQAKTKQIKTWTNERTKKQKRLLKVSPLFYAVQFYCAWGESRNFYPNLKLSTKILFNITIILRLEWILGHCPSPFLEQSVLKLKFPAEEKRERRWNFTNENHRLEFFKRCQNSLRLAFKLLFKWLVLCFDKACLSWIVKNVQIVVAISNGGELKTQV